MIICGISEFLLNMKLGFTSDIGKTIYAVGAGLALTFMLFLGPLVQLVYYFDIDDIPAFRGTLYLSVDSFSLNRPRGIIDV